VAQPQARSRRLALQQQKEKRFIDKSNKKKKKRLKKIQRKKFGRTDRTPTEMKVTDPPRDPPSPTFWCQFFL
jgi:hypothetical protein